jgi:hypothetical protein
VLRGGISYIEIDGFELEWVADPSVGRRGRRQGPRRGDRPMYASHHLRFLNNVIHGYGTGGICSLDCDYLYLEGQRHLRHGEDFPLRRQARSRSAGA